jgi:hypothetical protein
MFQVLKSISEENFKIFLEFGLDKQLNKLAKKRIRSKVPTHLINQIFDQNYKV